MKIITTLTALAALALVTPATAQAQLTDASLASPSVSQCQFIQTTIGELTITTIFNCRQISRTVV